MPSWICPKKASKPNPKPDSLECFTITRMTTIYFLGMAVMLVKFCMDFS